MRKIQKEAQETNHSNYLLGKIVGWKTGEQETEDRGHSLFFILFDF